MNCRKEELLLYAVTDQSGRNGRTLYEQVEEALLGGATMVQLREKKMQKEKLCEQAKNIKRLCAKYQVPFLINDDAALAYEVDADGVHVGQNDMDILDARSILGPDKYIGASARTVEQAVLAWQKGADYLGVGAVFPTKTKQDAQVICYERLQAICKAVPIPVVAIGGITKENVSKLTGSGISGIAVVSAIFAQSDIRLAAKELLAAAKETVQGKGVSNGTVL